MVELYSVNVPTLTHCANPAHWQDFLLGTVVFATAVIANAEQLKNLAKRIGSRMRSLGLNETQLSERCSVASIHLFENNDAPGLTRDRIAKILMNRQEVPAKSAARKITPRELKVLSRVLNVSPEWLIGQEQNRDPVVWNVLAQPDRVQTFSQLLQAYEELSEQTTVWSRYPLYAYMADDFVHAFNQVYYGGMNGDGNSQPLVEFYDSLARARRKSLLRSNRNFELINVLFKKDFEQIVVGEGIYSVISTPRLVRNIQVIIETITNPSLRLKLVLIENADLSISERLRGYDLLAAVNSHFSVWGYHNGDIGWSEHSAYVNSHRCLLETLNSQPHSDLNETVEYLESLKSKIRSRSMTMAR